MASCPLPTVLIVDDSEGVCLALSMMLEKHGFRAHTAHTFDEGLRLANQQSFDVILVDANLGSDSGLTLGEQLLQSDPRRRLILMSGSIDIVREAERRPALSGLPVLEKPFTRQEMIEAIKKLVKNRAA